MSGARKSTRIRVAALIGSVAAIAACAAPGAQAAQLVSFTQSTVAVSTNLPAPTVSFSAHILNMPTGDTSASATIGADAPAANAYAEVASSTPGIGRQIATVNSAYESPGVLLGDGASANVTLTSGTDTDGIWTGVMTLPAGFSGTYSFTQLTSLNQAQGWYVSADASTLSAAGAEPITATATVAPSAPTQLAASTTYHCQGDPTQTCGLASVFTGVAPANALAVTLDSLTGIACGLPAADLASGAPGVPVPFEFQFFLHGLGLCSVHFHAWNSAGRSPEASAIGWFW